MSGGKDSTATALLALELQPRDSIRFVFADTGNEHEITYKYLEYLEQTLGIAILRLRRSFAHELARKREYVLTKWPGKGVPAAIIERAADILSRPTGNPYLDLCLWKGRFPSRKAQFCTQFLKTEPLVEYQMSLIDAGAIVWSWQGIRAEESPRRALAPEFEEVGGGLYIMRPIKRWTAADAIEAHAAAGIEPNQLYRMGMTRVGCMPCINASKSEIAQIAKRFPEHVDRIEEWEALVGQAGKRLGIIGFFPAPEDGRAERQGRNIREIVRWAGTTRGGYQGDLLRAAEDPAMCSSAYGLCE